MLGVIIGYLSLSSKFFHSRENSLLKVQFRMISCIYVNPYADECRFKCFFGSRIQHLGSYGSRVGIPTDEDNFWRRATIIRFKFNINQPIAAVVFWKLLNKIVVCLTLIALFLDDYCLLIFDLINEVTQIVRFLPQFEFVEGCRNFVGYLYTGRLATSKPRQNWREEN